KKWPKYSGLFVLLKRKWKLPKNDFDRIFNSVLLAFIDLVLSPVPTHV
ncbi:MAG: transposase, partial [Anaerolineaceae bacterium]|nr:transposase [Anaerolineaceae bacterium]